MRLNPGIGKSLLLLGLALAAGAAPADAQRPFRMHDPFYKGETGRRAFFDGYAFTTEVNYRAPGTVRDGQEVASADPFGLSFRLDYALLQHFDLGAIVDASGGNSGRTVSLSWVVFKYYRTVDQSDYAFRLAVDPSSDGRTGFPQMDLAFISSSLLSAAISSDYAIGVRRVRVGYERWVPQSDDPPTQVPEYPLTSDILYTRALGWELHAAMQYSVLLNPARNNVFVGLMVDRGQYNLVETSMRAQAAAAAAAAGKRSDERTWKDSYRTGTLWLRTGLEYNRPAYQVTPFVSVPLRQWLPDNDKASTRPGYEPRARISMGLRFMLR